MSAERRFQTSYRETDTTEPGLVLEDDGTIWQVKPDGTRAQIGTANGGSQTVTQERIDSFTEVATDTPLNWAKGFGDDLLDFSDPAAPTVIEAGTYALSLFVFFGAFTSGSWMHIDVEMDSDNDDWDIHNTAPLVAGASNTGVGVSITAKIPAGAKLVCTLYSDAVLPGGAGATMRGQIAKIA